MSILERLTCETADLGEENVRKLLALFPECACEQGQVDFDKLRQVLSSHVIEGDVERYQFTWPGKRAAMSEANRKTNKTFRPVREASVNFDTTENLYIEGDNLEALKLLQSAYAGKVKMIYIDPPYNTGKDFVYRDRFSLTQKEIEDTAGAFDEEGNRYEKNDSAEARYHTNWCNMMYPRLKLARELLSDDGVIFISIDDSEVAQLRKICDEIFGENNFVIDFLWKKKGTTSNVEGAEVSSLTDSTICYKKTSLAHIKPRVRSKDTRAYPHHDDTGCYRTTVIEKKDSGEYKRESMKYEILGHKPREGKRWQIGFDKAKEYEKLNRFIFDGEKILLKIYDFEDKDTTSAQPNILEDCGSTDSAAQMVNVELFNIPELFDNPKPIELVCKLNYFANTKDCIILDFFSGSATTAHAVMQLNAEDGGKRKFILVQLPEVTDEKSEAYKAGYKNICEIGKERIRRAGKKIQEEHATTAPNLDVGFRVLKIDSSSINDVSKPVNEMSQEEMNFESERIKADRSSEDLLFQVLLQTQIPLSEKIERETICGNEVFTVGGVMVACLDKQAKLTEAFFTALAERQPAMAFFRDDTFVDDSARTNLEQIFKQFSKDTKIKVL